MNDFSDLLDVVLGLKRELAEAKTMIRNMVRTGTVEERDAKKGYRVNWGNDDEGKPILSPWMPHPEAGGMDKSWNPLAKGEIVTSINPGGDPRQGFLVRGGFGGQFAQPSENLDESVRELQGGKVREVASKDGDLTVTLKSETIKASGTVTIEAAVLVLKAGQIQMIET